MSGDNFYWSPLGIEPEESTQHIEPYVDPWDLENYLYIRKNLDYLELKSATSFSCDNSEEFAEASSHSFYYLSGK